MLGVNVCVRMNGENSKCQNSCKHTYARSMERKCSEIFWGRIQRSVIRIGMLSELTMWIALFGAKRIELICLLNDIWIFKFFFMHKFVSLATASLAVIIMLDSQVLFAMYIYIEKTLLITIISAIFCTFFRGGKVNIRTLDRWLHYLYYSMKPSSTHFQCDPWMPVKEYWYLQKETADIFQQFFLNLNPFPTHNKKSHKKMKSSKTTTKARPKKPRHGFHSLYYMLRFACLWPFKIIYRSNGSIKEASVHLFEVLWFLISSRVHLFFYNSNFEG